MYIYIQGSDQVSAMHSPPPLQIALEKKEKKKLRKRNV